MAENHANLKDEYDLHAHFALELRIEDTTIALRLSDMLRADCDAKLPEKNQIQEEHHDTDWALFPLIEILRKYNATVGREMDIFPAKSNMARVIAEMSKKIAQQYRQDNNDLPHPLENPATRQFFEDAVKSFYITAPHHAHLFQIHQDLSNLATHNRPWLSPQTFRRLSDFNPDNATTAKERINQYIPIKTSANSSMYSENPTGKTSGTDAGQVHIATSPGDFITLNHDI